MTQTLDDLSVLALMLDPDDSQSFEMAMILLDELKAEVASHDPDNQQLLTLFSEAVKRHTEGSYKILLDIINEIVSSANKSPAASNDNATTQVALADISSELDPELVSEFISSHTLELQDFETEILSHGTQNVTEEESIALTRFLKSYLHNIKGDAGSVGLIGISRATHIIEDTLAVYPVGQLVNVLIAFKEWVTECMVELAAGNTPPRSADQFIGMMQQMLNADPESNEVFALESDTEGNHGNTSNEALESYRIAEEDDLLNDFLVEGEEHLTATEGILLEPKDSYPVDDINTIFRAVHSIKGGAGYFNLREVVSSSHTTETLLDKARSGETVFDSTLRELMIDYVDFQRALFARIRNAMNGDRTIVADQEIAKFITRVEARLLGKAIPTASKSSSPTVEQHPTTVASTESTMMDQSTTSQDKGSAGAAKIEKRETVEYIKVDTKRLDKLLEYIGEMVTASSMLIRKGRLLLPEDEELSEHSHQLEMIVREVQDIGMSLRLVPIKALFQKMSRVVWDTAKKVNKPIQFHVEGEETELDRTLIERLADPLMHMVRNAVDHGIEPNDMRAKTNKPAQGNVTLRAYHKAGCIYVEIEDDGRGLDPKVLINKAREKGIIENDRVLSDEEAFALIFAPGFSTAAQITDVSGRGVGMDVVRKNIESLRGKVTIHSVLGKGSIFRIELPLTLAIVDGIEVSVAQQRFLVPTSAIIEIIKLTPEMLVTTLDRGETLRFRDDYLPLYPLADILGSQREKCANAQQTAIIVQNGTELAAFKIDEVLGQVSTVIKSLGSIFKDLEGLAGCAIMPDGKIGIILDVNGLVERAHAKLQFPATTTIVLADEHIISDAPMTH